MEKLRILMVTIAVMAIVSCAGYLTSDDGSTASDDDHINTLAIVDIDGGGFISSDTNNDITPFLYRETNGSNPVLFFASDRDGSYDIWMARMSNNGQFSAPEKMDILINTTSNEFSPVVFKSSDRLFITFLQYINESDPNLLTYELNTIDMSVISNFQIYGLGDTTNIGLYYGSDDCLYLYAANGTANCTQYEFYISSGWGEITPDPFPTNVYSASGFQESDIVLQMSGDYKIFTAIAGEKQQIYLSASVDSSMPGFYTNVSYFISDYTSTHNDKDPMIDHFDPAKKVYFSSDRTGKDVYDLYRYNIKTFEEVVEQYPFEEYISNQIGL